jgi:mono/diheme cytochrome c family protein
MMPPPMARPHKLLAAMVLAGASAVTLAACGSEGVEVPADNPNHRGAELFAERCSGCHTLSAAGTEGSANSLRYTERTDGPNLDDRRETVQDVLYAIRNGGFSGAIMPQTIVVGEDAQAVAEFVAKYAGSQAEGSPDAPKSPEP